MDYQGIYSWKYLVKKRRKWFIARTVFSEFPENTSLSGQLHPWTLYSREEPVWRKHSWTEQRRLRQDLQPPLAATLSTLKPCCSSYVCTLFLPNFINICHCQLQPERIPVASSVSEKSLNWRQCLPRSVRIVGPLKLSQMLQGSINCCSDIVLTSFLIVIFVTPFLHEQFHDCTYEAVWLWKHYQSSQNGHCNFATLYFVY